ncbi:PAS domain-containing sensor histidine kinase [Cytobacillus firmus]|uniref:histidine kinase n=1 Tax=Cytobacillus firmus DS1 TaxID=1307436 RepID=W7LJM2_CYTFI|nr:PAS domain-containing sensor histidine kinase [Cytobacillus firmus]EWG12309.1 two-component sensor histidine kinase [Cytobacillus firmus DS1]
MKYTGRIWALGILLFSGAIFKIFTYLSLGYIPLTEWILNAIFIYPVWWSGLQFDKAKYYAKEIKKKDEELNELFNSVDAVIYSFDLRSKKLMISSKVSDLYGYSSDEFKNNLQLWKEVVYKEDIDIVSKFEHELKKGKDAIGEYRILLPNGELKWIQKRVKPIFDSSRNLIKLNGIDIDINQRKKVEELLNHSQEKNRKLLVKRLEETEQRFKSLFVNNTDAIFTFNLNGKLIEANNAAGKLLGYTIEELQKKEWDEIIVPEDLEKHMEHYKYVSDGQRQEFTLSMIHKDGKKRAISLKMIPIITDNEFIGIYEIAKDITESKLAEEMIRRSDKLSAVGQLAAGVAHEIRNPLTTLKGFVQLLKPDISKTYVDIMLSELDRINLIVSEFLILSKPQVIKYEYQDINQILKSIISLLEPQAIIKKIQIISEFELNLPFIKCEQNQLKQVAINLLKNAIEAMPNGGEITVKVKGINEKMVSILIIDQGVGIENAQITKLGEPFYTTKEDGTGLGLMICFRIIENHGGTMRISSQLNKGTTVELCLPVDHPFEKDNLS